MVMEEEDKCRSCSREMKRGWGGHAMMMTLRCVCVMYVMSMDWVWNGWGDWMWGNWGRILCRGDNYLPLSVSLSVDGWMDEQLMRSCWLRDDDNKVVMMMIHTFNCKEEEIRVLWWLESNGAEKERKKEGSHMNNIEFVFRMEWNRVEISVGQWNTNTGDYEYDD